LPGREKLALSTGSGIRLEINWCGAKKFLAFTAEGEHNSSKRDAEKHASPKGVLRTNRRAGCSWKWRVVK